MPFKNEEIMKLAINAIEQGVGANKWRECSFLDSEGNSCAVGLMAVAVEITPPLEISERALSKDEISAENEEFVRFINGVQYAYGITEEDRLSIEIANDWLGPRAAIESIKRIGHKNDR